INRCVMTNAQVSMTNRAPMLKVPSGHWCLVIGVSLSWSLVLGHWSFGQEWAGPVQGSWVREGEAQAGDAVIADEKGVCEIVVGETENPAVKRAAECLAGDIEKITGKKPAIVPKPVSARRGIHLSTAPGDGANAKWNFSFHPGDWEGYQIKAVGGQVYLTGSDFRGTAFAAYTLCGR